MPGIALDNESAALLAQHLRTLCDEVVPMAQIRAWATALSNPSELPPALRELEARGIAYECRSCGCLISANSHHRGWCSHGE